MPTATEQTPRSKTEFDLFDEDTTHSPPPPSATLRQAEDPLRTRYQTFLNRYGRGIGFLLASEPRPPLQEFILYVPDSLFEPRFTVAWNGSPVYAHCYLPSEGATLLAVGPAAVFGLRAMAAADDLLPFVRDAPLSLR